MNLQPQCVYGGSHSNLSTFRRREMRHRHRTIIKDIVIALIVFAVLTAGYLALNRYCNNQAIAADAHHACIATTIASIENSDGV